MSSWESLKRSLLLLSPRKWNSPTTADSFWKAIPQHESSTTFLEMALSNNHCILQLAAKAVHTG